MAAIKEELGNISASTQFRRGFDAQLETFLDDNGASEPARGSSEKDMLELARRMEKICADAKRTVRELVDLCTRYSEDDADIDSVERIYKHLCDKVGVHTRGIDRLSLKIGQELKKASPTALAVAGDSLSMATEIGKKTTSALTHAVKDVATKQEQHIRRYMKLLHPKANELTDDEIDALKKRVDEVGTTKVLAQETLKKKETHTRVAHHLMVEANEVRSCRGSYQAHRFHVMVVLSVVPCQLLTLSALIASPSSSRRSTPALAPYSVRKTAWKRCRELRLRL
jgi:hypothetical protein